MGRVRRAAALDLLVAGRRKRARLGPFLHRGLGVAGRLFVGGDAIAPTVKDERLGRVEAAIDEHRPDEGLAHIRQDRLLLTAAPAGFAETQRDMGADVPLSSDFGAGLTAHELREPHRQFAFARLRKGLVEPARDHDAQNPVA